jgi:hypothetical protein
LQLRKNTVATSFATERIEVSVATPLATGK